MLKRNPTDWYAEAVKRPVRVPHEELRKRMKLAASLRQLTAEYAEQPTKEMIADEMLLMMGKMERSEFNQYLACKYGE